MILNEKNFCPNVRNVSDSMRVSYICKKTGRICPKIDYSSGTALPSNAFIKNGCALNKEEKIEKVVEIKKEKEEIKVPAKKTTTRKNTTKQGEKKTTTQKKTTRKRKTTTKKK